MEAQKISTNVAKQNLVQNFQINPDIKKCLTDDLKKTRRELDRKIIFSKSFEKKEIKWISLERNHERWSKFLVNIRSLHHIYKAII